jgi:cyclophilin family peptidyl-prolyl cis-trans isomerase
MYLILKKCCWLAAFTIVINASVLGQKNNISSAKKNSLKIIAAKKPVLTNAIELSKQSITQERLAEISTDYGVMVLKLYDSTPLHRDNFIKLVEQKFYDSLLFHRIINQFMIQGGDPASKNIANGVSPGDDKAPGNRIAAEFKPYFFHKKGALAAARDDNPEKASSNSQFYIVQGKIIPQQDLDKIYNDRVKASNPSFKYTKTQKEIYNRIGGTPFLDQSYTVFGEVISGLDVIDKIAGLPKDASDKPIQNVRMKIRMIN